MHLGDISMHEPYQICQIPWVINLEVPKDSKNMMLLFPYHENITFMIFQIVNIYLCFYWRYSEGNSLIDFSNQYNNKTVAK